MLYRLFQNNIRHETSRCHFRSQSRRQSEHYEDDHLQSFRIRYLHNLGSALLYFFAFAGMNNEIDVILSVIFREVVQSSSVRNLLTSMARNVEGMKWKIRPLASSLSLEQTQVHISKVPSKFQGFEAFLKATAFLKDYIYRYIR